MTEPNWVALGGGAVDYVGGWAAGTAYRSGDVVRHNGIEYLAVNPSTGQAPAPAAPLLTGRELAYAERTSTLSVTATVQASADVIVNAPPITVDGATQILVECYTSGMTAGANWIQTLMYEDGVCIGILGTYTVGAQVVPNYAARKLTPTAGTHTYGFRAYVNGGTGTIAAGIGGAVSVPAFIRVSTVQPTAVAVRTFTAPGIGTTLPASPVDGDEYILVDSLTAPTYQWHFRFMAAKGSNKWVFVGGAETYAEVVTAEAINSGTYLAVTTPGPSIVIPVAGDYFIEQGFWSNTSSSALYTLMSYDIGGTAAVDADAAKNMVTQAGFQTASVMRRRRKSLPAATLTAKYRTVSGSCTILDRWMSAIPIAVGG